MGAGNMNVDWAKVKFFFCDERMVPLDDADSTFGVYKNSAIFKLAGVSESRGAIYQFLNIILQLIILVLLLVSTLPYVVKVKNHS
jgi:hypothetical protein